LDVAEATGLPAVLDELGAGEDVIAEATQLELAEQLGLRPIPERPAGTGTRAGRRNVRNQRIADYLIRRHGDPLETLVMMAQMGVEELVAALGCTRGEAWAEKRLAALGTLPYLHQRQPLAVQVSDHKVVHLTIVDGAESAAPGVAATIVGVVENQEVSDGGDDAV
jgi:hypothetical protein